MPASTKAELRDAIKRESRIKTGSTLDPLVDSIVRDILTDYCNLARYHELLKEGEVIPLVKGQQSYALPVDFGNMSVVRYGRGTSPSAFRVVDPQPESVAQSFSGGLPRFYRLVSGSRISFWPYTNIEVQDQLVIDYYIDPNSVFALETDVFPIPRLESAVKKDAIARIQRFHSDMPGAQMTDVDGRASFNAADGAS